MEYVLSCFSMLLFVLAFIFILFIFYLELEKQGTNL